jgi:hypothetical protein
MGMARWLGWLLVASSLLSCAKAPAKEAETEPSAAVRARYLEASERLKRDFIDEGFVVSRNAETGAPEHVGDALIWTGVALFALPCDLGNELDNAAIAMVDELDGGLYRHPKLPDAVSMDGALGLYFGVASRVARCPGARERWADPMGKHLAFVRENGGLLNRKSTSRLELHFDAPLYALVGVPDAHRQADMEKEAAAWALAVKVKHAACFRVNLGYLALRTIEEAGGAVTDSGRNSFCAATAGLGLAHVDHWCGRDGLEAFVAGFEFDRWEVALQRCPGWETPDGQGFHTPGVDLLWAMRELYQL